MTQITSREDMLAAVAKATEAARLYYNSRAESAMSDQEYDQLVEAIEEAAEDFPDVEGATELLTQVAAGTGAGDIPHAIPMLSLKKVKTTEEIARFEERITALGTKLLVELKLDGVALSARYKDGVLVQGLNRGDGTTGKDITARILDHVSGLPSRLSAPVTGEVRGEVYMTTAQYEKTSAARMAAARADFYSKKNNAGKDFDEQKFAFANSRNATSGLVNRDDAPGYAYQLSFAAYDIIFDSAPADHQGLLSDSYSERVAAAAALGITAASSLIKIESEALMDMINEIGEKRQQIDIPTDGCVIKPDSMSVRARLGNGSRHPNHSVAYKYASATGVSNVEDIEVGVGRTGRISLRARITPVLVMGTVITYASLHNPSWLEDKDARIGSRVTVKRANDVIPQIEEVLSHPENSAPYEVPQTCPKCDNPWNKDSLLWRCESPECGILPSVVYAASRDALDIEGLSEAMAALLVDNDLVEDAGDLFSLTKEQIAGLPTGRFYSATKENYQKALAGEPVLVGDTIAGKIIAEIEKAKSKPLARVLTALGMRATGRGISRRLAERYGTMDALLAASVDDLAQTDKIGKVKSEIIHSEIQRLTPVIEKMRAAGVNMGEAEAAEAEVQTQDSATQVLAGKNVCVTGSMKGSALDGLSRTEVQETIERFGGRAASSVSKTTHILVCEPGATSSKLKKAQTLGTVEILSPDEFANLLGLTA